VSPRRIVVLGLLAKMPVGGVVWQTLAYLVGLERLGFETYYVDAHARTPSMFLTRPTDDGWARAGSFLERIMGRFGFAGRWAYDALDMDRCFGMSRRQLHELYRSAELIVNLHGGTEPRPEHSETGRLIYVETDPIEVQLQLAEGRRETVEFLEQHVAHFTFAENLGGGDCKVPVPQGFRFHPTRQPVLLDAWEGYRGRSGDLFTTVGNWEQTWRDITFRGEVYHWSKHHEFLKFLDLPRRTSRRFELALSSGSHTPKQKAQLEREGWRVRDALQFSMDIDAYRDYIGTSRGEFTVAKDQNVRLRSGWFSDRSATYLAAGKPVITQETGFSNVLPVGAGLFPFETMEEILAAVEIIDADYARQSRAAFEVAQECFRHDLVLRDLLERVGVEMRRTTGPLRVSGIPNDLVLTPVSRRPLRLPEASVQTIESMPQVPQLLAAEAASASADASIIVVTYNQLLLTKLCLTSLMGNPAGPGLEMVVVDNGSMDGTREYLSELARRRPDVQLRLNERNRGFAAASNQGLSMARSDRLFLLNNDTIVPPGWLEPLLRHLEDPAVGLVGPVTNRCGNEAQVRASYRTHGELLRFAREREREREPEGQAFDIRTLTMFCVGMRRDVFEQVGTLDERFEVGLFEDEDYSVRVHRAGLRVLCAEDSFVHHFGQGTFGELVPSGEYGELFQANRRRFEEKWRTRWEPYRLRQDAAYVDLVARVKEAVDDFVPPGATVAVVSKGDEELLELDGRRAWHFPRTDDGAYAGFYPADDVEAVAAVESIREAGAEFLVFPATGFWWLEHYRDLAKHLAGRYRPLSGAEDACRIYSLRGGVV
jgi:GT2 family glycosyltransferase